MTRPARLQTLRCLAVLAALVALPGAGRSEIAPEPLGRVERLPERWGPHWFWLSDVMLHRTALFDGDTGQQLGTISSGTAGVGFVIAPMFAPDRSEIYIAETYYARGVRGERTDVVTVYDGRTLEPAAEIPIPAKRGEYFPGVAANALSDDGRFMAVFNVTPATSISVVDVRARRFTAEVPTPGCGTVYAAGPRRFFLLCANGEALVVTLDEQGVAASVSRTAAFFDAQNDPLTEKAARHGSTWLFSSFAGVVHPVDVSGDTLGFGEHWPLFDDADRTANWRIGGQQQLAVHGPTGRLYALVHQGGPDTHKDPGTEVWVYDLQTRRRLQRISMVNPLVSFIGLMSGMGGGMAGRAALWTLERVAPNPGVDRIAVTQDGAPVLIASASMPPAVTLHDAMSGAVVREVSEPGIASSLLFAP